jgi:hypothetical protein
VMRALQLSLGLTLSSLLFGCAPIATSGPGCTPVQRTQVLPDELRESSGVAVGVRDTDVLWTHSDNGPPLYAVDRAGHILARFPIPRRLRDWEDIEVARCPAGTCLYLADTGDNAEVRRPGNIKVLRVPEPDVAAPGPLAPDVFPIRLPDGPRDIEALFVLPGERLYLVTKGRHDPVSVYRYPPPLRPDTVTLEEVQRLTDGPQELLSQVTGASASLDGSLVAIRTYESLQFYHVQGDTLAAMPGGLVNLRTLEETQGEGVGIGPGGEVALTSEGGPLGGPASLRVLRCKI